jgi:putative ATP-dependent endonuclease of the OLD family
MKLKEFRIKNFRAYKNQVSILFDDLTVFIGRNDIGKSTILEALNIFFNDKPDKLDLNVNSEEDYILFTAIFSELPTSLILDEKTPTSLEDEYLVNENGELEIIKKFRIGASLTEETFIRCKIPNESELDNLLTMKLSTLKLKSQELGIDMSGIDKRISKDIRLAIRNHYFPSGVDNFKIENIKIDGKLDNEDNLKKVWSGLRSYLPIFSLFNVDKPLNDQDADIQDPMKEIIKEVLQRPGIISLLDDLKNEIQSASTHLADQTIQKLNEIDTRLAETLRSTFPKEPGWNSIFKLTLEDNRGVPLNKRGSGMRRLVLLSFFRAQVENRVFGTAPNIIYALEEPETSQHPDFQLMIVNALKELSQTENAQVIFTTHNSNLAKEIPTQSLRYISDTKSGVEIESGANDDGTINSEIIDQIISTLGALPDPKNKVKVLVFVEGEKDINALVNYSILFNSIYPDIPILADNEAVAFIPVGGSQLKFYIEKKYLDGLTQAQVHIYDGDIQDYVDFVLAINAEQNSKKIGFNTTCNEIENFLHHDAINEAYKDDGLSISISPFGPFDDVPLLVAKTVYETTTGNDWNKIDPLKIKEKQKSKISRAKHFLNNQAILKMNADRLKESGGFDEIKTWLIQINAYIQN